MRNREIIRSLIVLLIMLVIAGLIVGLSVYFKNNPIKLSDLISKYKPGESGNKMDVGESMTIKNFDLYYSGNKVEPGSTLELLPYMDNEFMFESDRDYRLIVVVDESTVLDFDCNDQLTALIPAIDLTVGTIITKTEIGFNFRYTDIKSMLRAVYVGSDVEIDSAYRGSEYLFKVMIVDSENKLLNEFKFNISLDYLDELMWYDGEIVF